MRVCALTSGPTVPSAKFRVRQYIPFLKKLGINVSEFNPYWNKFDPPPNELRKWLQYFKIDTPVTWNRLKYVDRYKAVISSHFFSVCWLQKVLIPYHLTLEKKVKHPMVFDLDDAIWLDEGKGFTDKILQNSEVVFAGNSYLADWCSRYHKKVIVIPTAVDTSIYKPVYRNTNSFVIGWIGTSGNFKFLKKIELSLKQFLNKRKDSFLKIIADRFPVELSDIAERIHFVKWDESLHVSEMYDFSIGIMPIENDEWGKGKCSYKMLQYMAMGKPVIVSPFGMNNELLGSGAVGYGAITNDDWFDCFELAYNNNYSSSIQNESVKIVEEYYSTDSVSQTIALQLNKIIS